MSGSVNLERALSLASDISTSFGNAQHIGISMDRRNQIMKLLNLDLEKLGDIGHLSIGELQALDLPLKDPVLYNKLRILTALIRR